MEKRKDTFPLKAGECYIYEGKIRGKGWNPEGRMDFILEKKPLKVMDISQYRGVSVRYDGALVRFKHQRMAWYLTLRECKRFKRVDAPQKEERR